MAGGMERQAPHHALTRPLLVHSIVCIASKVVSERGPGHAGAGQSIPGV
jgi:hypothetical protein